MNFNSNSQEDNAVIDYINTIPIEDEEFTRR